MTIVCSVVVPTYRRPDLLARCLTALAEQTLPAEQYEVVVADDAASSDTRLQVQSAASSGRGAVRYIPVTGAHGPAAARNAGWQAAGGEIIAFTDDDCVPDPQWLENGCRWLRTSQAAAAAGRVIMPLPDDPTDYERDASGLTRAEFVTANCFCRRQVLEQVGGFDERFTAAWREDSDLQFTLLEQGFPIVRADDAVVVHPVRPAAWGISLKQQRKTQFDALLRAKHPQWYRTRIAPVPATYYAIAAALATAVGGTALSTGVSLAGLGLWCALTAEFCLRRLAQTSRRPSHVAEMIVTSALIPPLSLFWHGYGCWRFAGVSQGRPRVFEKERDDGTAAIPADRAGGPMQSRMPDVLDSVPARWPHARSAGVHDVGSVLPDSGPIPAA